PALSPRHYTGRNARQGNEGRRQLRQLAAAKSEPLSTMSLEKHFLNHSGSGFAFDQRGPPV
ncbi:hypothetical protein, partial [Mesorhizobium sp. dw_380]|uniref:hypothetical protein n=1 Tax=Mesorhizobium sp. dw_380 TaxID=2812001 RepID=UPI001BDEFFF7